MDPSWLIVVSVLGLLLAPLWAKLANRLVMRRRTPSRSRGTAVIFLSLAAFAITCVGPWVLMCWLQGRFPSLLYAPGTAPASAIILGPGVLVQIICAAAFLAKNRKATS